MRLDLLAPSPAGRVLHLVHEIEWGASPMTFHPLCRWGTVWPVSGWSTLIRIDAPEFDRDTRPVCRRCLQTARWRVDQIVEQFETINAHALALPSSR